MEIKATEDNLGINKSVCELHSPQEQTKLIRPTFMISPIIKSIIKKATKDWYGKSHQEILGATVHYIKKKLFLNAGLDPNLQQDSLGLRPRNTLNYSGKSNLVFNVFPTQQTVFQSKDLSGTYGKLKHFLSLRPPQGGHIRSIPSIQHYWELFTK